MEKSLQSFIAKMIPAPDPQFTRVGGGSINECFRMESGRKQFFCKINSAQQFPGLFEQEKNGLEFLRNTGSIRVPKVIWSGESAGQQILVLEWIDQGARSPAFWATFGKQLAWLHQIHSISPTMVSFGFPENNYMGALKQVNTPLPNWIEFFRTCRLQPQVELAVKNNLLPSAMADQFQHLYVKLNSIFSPELPSALHGDLWSGNFLCDEHSSPVLIDPASYFGHRSMDLAMSILFGRFDDAFYEAYDYYFPLPQNYEEQWDICNLYPLLIHLNLFGSEYLSSIRSILFRFA